MLSRTLSVTPAAAALTVLFTLLTQGCGLAADRSQPSQPTSLARTHSGELHGTRDGDVLRFRGIPYAQPPTGALRWTPPQPVRPWRGEKAADRSGPPCAQTGKPPTGSTAEDCLHLDVTEPAASYTKLRPVMVWLHGGGFSAGRGSQYDPGRMVARGGVVVVTVDFRLGIFANLALRGMSDGGSYALQDQQAALRWIKDNAKAFGGNPDNITLFGQSGGGVAVCGQLTSPGARGLFARAILQSGSCDTTLAANASGPGTPAFGVFWRPMAEAERTGAAIAAKLGCTGQATMLSCLRRVPVSRLLTQSNSATAAGVGGKTLPVDPREALSRGDVARVPVLSGNALNEQRLVAGLYELLGKPITAAQYPGLLTQGFGTGAAAVQEEYPLDRYPSAALAWAAVDTDSGFVCPQLHADDALSAHDPVFGYEFADATAPPVIPMPNDFPPGASHASELFYLFDQPGLPVLINGKTYSLTPAQYRLADRMITAWTTFARTGNPAGTRGSALWPGWHRRSALVHQFTARADRPRLADPAAEHHCGFWATHS
jgi:para-nitrobenzyl esterase